MAKTNAKIIPITMYPTVVNYLEVIFEPLDESD